MTTENPPNQALLNKSERITDNGIALLRVASGLFFLLPGVYKVLNPADFQAMLAGFPDFLHPLLPLFFYVVIVSEIVGGILLIIGWNSRVAAVPLIVITIVAEILVVANDHNSQLRVLSLFAHVMGAGLYSGIIFLGSGRWSLGRYFSFLNWLAQKKPKLLYGFPRWVVSGAGHNFGIQLIRFSVALPFIAAFFLGISNTEYAALLPQSAFIKWPLLLLALIGGLSVMTGFQLKTMGWVLVALTVIHMLTVGLADISLSAIGLINILFHLLILAAVVSLRLISFGSELEVEHILSRDKRNVVVIGGGFAGTQLVKKLERQLSQEWQVVLISEENYMTFNPMLAEVVGASILPSHVIAPIRRMIRRTRFVSARVTNVDLDAKEVHFEGEDKLGSIGYEHLVFAFGSRANMDLVDGMQAHAMPFKLLGDALNLRNRVIQQMEKADQEIEPDRRSWMGHFIVIGAGFSGVEVGGAIQDFIRASQKHYPRLNDHDLKVSIVHRSEVPLQELSEQLGAHTLEHMVKRGVNMVMSARVGAVDAEGVTLSSGERLDGATVISTIGTRPNPIMGNLSIPAERGRISVNPDMSVVDNPGLWAIGDCALVPNAFDDKLSPPTAQFAIREGRQLAANIARVITGLDTVPFNYQSRGSMATIGHLNGVAELFSKIRLGGFSAWLVWRAFYLMLMPTFAKRTRIFFEWTWSMLFSPDIINLRFTTTKSADVTRGKQSAENDLPDGVWASSGSNTE